MLPPDAVLALIMPADAVVVAAVERDATGLAVEVVGGEPLFVANVDDDDSVVLVVVADDVERRACSCSSSICSWCFLMKFFFGSGLSVSVNGHPLRNFFGVFISGDCCCTADAVVVGVVATVGKAVCIMLLSE